MINLGEVNENTTSILNMDFIDESGNPVTPTSANYRIDTVKGVAVTAQTPFTPTGSNHKLTLSIADNTMKDSTLAYELRIITISFQYGASKQGNDEFKYSVKNLSFG